jgi:hypothetical protein
LAGKGSPRVSRSRGRIAPYEEARTTVSVSVTGCVGPMVPVPAPPAASGHKIDERCRVNKSLARRRFWQRHPFLVRQVGHEVQRLGRERGRLCRYGREGCPAHKAHDYKRAFKPPREHEETVGARWLTEPIAGGPPRAGYALPGQTAPRVSRKVEPLRRPHAGSTLPLRAPIRRVAGAANYRPRLGLALPRRNGAQRAGRVII